MLYQQRPAWLNIFGTKSADDGKSAHLIEKADKFIRQDRLDSAGHYLDLLLSRRGDSTVSPLLLDTAESLRRQIRQIGLLDSGDFYLRVLLNIPDRDYEDFLEGRYSKKYLGHQELNKLFLNKLHSKILRQDRGTGGAENSADQRKAYAEAIRNSFVNLGFDISVESGGTADTRLILSAPEFNDEWFEKFESDSAMADWHSMGFQQVEIRGGSDYIRVKSW